MNPTIRPRRLFVSGGSCLSRNAALLWRHLGELLAAEDGLVVITGGLERVENGSATVTADRMIVEGMLVQLRKRGIAPELRLETFLPDLQYDSENLIRFKVGRIRVLKNRTKQARRFSLVHSADVVVSVEGDGGTRSVLDVAMAIERPMLPLPFRGDPAQEGGKASKMAWCAQREEILKWFRIGELEAGEFEQTNLADLDEAQVAALAARVHLCLMCGFTQSCFVIMRFDSETDPVFDRAIKPALLSLGYEPWRTDRTVPTGDVVAAIREGINHCYFSIADTTGDRPNVMYELGLAHATNKPVILLRALNQDGTLPPAPFDFQTQSILTYTNDKNGLRDLRRRLEAAISMVTGKTNHERQD